MGFWRRKLGFGFRILIYKEKKRAGVKIISIRNSNRFKRKFVLLLNQDYTKNETTLFDN